MYLPEYLTMKESEILRKLDGLIVAMRAELVEFTAGYRRVCRVSWMEV